MKLSRKGLSGLAMVAGLMATQFTAFAQQIAGPTCINYVAPAAPGAPNPAQTQYTYTFTPQNPGDVFVGWGKKGDVEIVSTSGTATASSYTATVQSTDYGRGEVRAYYSVNSCAPAEVRYQVNKTFDKLPDSRLTAPECVQGGQTYAFTVPPIISSAGQIAEQIGVDLYDWEDFPPGSVVDFSGDGSAATVTLPAGFSGGFTVAVTIGACNFNDGSKRMTKTISSRPSTPAITLVSGTTSCKTDTAPFTLSYQVQTGTNYLWRIPSGWQISPAGANVGAGISYPSVGLQTVTITPTNTNADIVSVTAKFPDGSGCGASEVASSPIQVTYQLTSANTINISSTGCLAPGSSVNLAVGGTSSNTSIQWSLPNGWAITSANPNDNNITVSVGTAGGTITASGVGCPGTISLPVTVSGNGGCNPSSFAVRRSSSRIFYIEDLTNPSNPSPTCLPDGLGANPSPITYIWTAGNQVRTEIGGSSEVLFPIPVPAGTNVSVQIQNTLTCLNYTITGNSLRPLGKRQPSTAKRAASSSLSSYPNPAQDELNVDLTLPAGGEAQLVIVDLVGRTVQQSTTRQDHTQLNVSKLPKGTYLLRAVLPDGKSISQKIQVQR